MALPSPTSPDSVLEAANPLAASPDAKSEAPCRSLPRPSCQRALCFTTPTQMLHRDPYVAVTGPVNRFINIAPQLLQGGCSRAPILTPHHDWWVMCIDSELAAPAPTVVLRQASPQLLPVHGNDWWSDMVQSEMAGGRCRLPTPRFWVLRPAPARPALRLLARQAPAPRRLPSRPLHCPLRRRCRILPLPRRLLSVLPRRPQPRLRSSLAT